MEVEVKLRLPSAAAHARVAELLKDKHEATYFQENVFFDGTNKELSQNSVTLRIRFYNNDEKCVVTVKGKSVLVDGIGRSTEEEEQMDPAFGRACVDDPSLLVASSSPLVVSLVTRLGCQGFRCLGSFHNVRMVYSWNSHKVELDETKFAFGTQYEVECESSEPEKIKQQLEEFLGSNGVPFTYSSATKFGTFRAGRLLD